MKTAAIILLAFLSVLSLSEQTLAQRPDCDKQCVSEVRGMLKVSYMGGSVSWLDKANARLGDKVGVAIFKIYQGRSLYKPDNIRTFLPVIQQAFESPEMIELVEHRNPLVTQPLLEKLQRRIKDHFLHLEITRTLNVVKFHSVAPDSSGGQATAH
jgi:hypothetical protein